MLISWIDLLHISSKFISTNKYLASFTKSTIRQVKHPNFRLTRPFHDASCYCESLKHMIVFFRSLHDCREEGGKIET